MKQELKNRLRAQILLPVVSAEEDKAVSVAQALYDGGIKAIEVTFRKEGAPDSIQKIRQALPDILIAAGTVIHIEQAKAAKEAGADLIVSPGYCQEVTDWCKDNEIDTLPGCSTASEVEKAVRSGIEVIKVFPSNLCLIQNLAGPFPDVLFIPSGGIGPDNVLDFLALTNVLAASGSWVAKGDPEQIEQASREAVKRILDFKLAHIGINASNEAEAKSIASFFETIYGWKAKENPSSIFSDTYVETIKSPYLGKNGHLAISTPGVERAKVWLESQGISFNEASTVYRDNGLIQAIYMEQEIGGFAVHLVRKA